MAFHQYNTFLYNTSQYNADAYLHVISLSETINSTDVNFETVIKVLLDTLTMSDTLTKSQYLNLVDSVLLLDSLTKEFTDKRLSETIKMNDWLSVRQNPQSNTWSD